MSWALLGLVIQRPSYGYELVQRFERTFDGALELSSPSQIYTALDTLARRGLIEEIALEEELGDEPTRQPKPHYRATDTGLCSYEEWLIAHIPDERRRSQLFARLLAVLAPDAGLAIVERCERACLDRAGGIPLNKGAVPTGCNGDLVAKLLCEEERLTTNARLAWLEYARRELRAIAGARPPGS